VPRLSHMWQGVVVEAVHVLGAVCLSGNDAVLDAVLRLLVCLSFDEAFREEMVHQGVVAKVRRTPESVCLSGYVGLRSLSVSQGT
jgi:hypothetical protein